MSELESQLEECGVCHALHPYNALACFDDTLICAECLEDSTVICGRCDERLWRDDGADNEDSGHLCQSYYDRYYNTCQDNLSRCAYRDLTYIVKWKYNNPKERRCSHVSQNNRSHLLPSP